MADEYSGSPSSRGGGALASWKGERPLAVVTGASSGIGYELARVCALNGFDLVAAADHANIQEAAKQFSKLGVNVCAVEADLSKQGGVEKLYGSVRELGRPVDVLCANAGRGLGGAFLDQDWIEIMDVIGTNVTGTLFLLAKVRPRHARGRPRMMRGKAHVVHGFKNKLQTVASNVLPVRWTSEAHRMQAAPGSGH